MNTLLIFAFIIGAASAYDERCAWGESYWCSGISQAKDCGAFSHCITTVWPRQQLQDDKSDVCTYCKNIIQDVRNFIGNKQSQAQIQQFLASACSIIPEKQIAQECQETVKAYLPEVLDLITAELDPQVVCSLMGVCSGLEDKVTHNAVLHHVPLMKTPIVARTPVPICADCKKFMQDIKAMATSPQAEQQLEAMIDAELCSELGSLEDECKALVAVYVPELMDLLAGEFDPAMLCSSLGFCGQSSPDIRTLLARLRMAKTTLYKTASRVSGTEECELCKTIIGELQAIEEDKTTQTELEDFVKNEICTNLGALKGACDEAVDQYGPEIFLLLAQELDPNAFCAAIGLCSGQQISNSIENKLDEKANVKSADTCILCEFVMKEIDDMLANNATEAEIVAALDKVCSILPSDIGAECTAFVNTYGPGILLLLEQELQPKLVCSSLGLCSSKTLRFVPKKTIKSSEKEMCGICQTAMQYLDTILTDNATITEIEAALNKLCGILPQTMKDECTIIVNTYGPVIIKLIPQFADPTEVCQAIGLCDKTTATTQKPVLLGTNECTYGPSYWCASKENARKCKAEEHCRRHVWNV